MSPNGYVVRRAGEAWVVRRDTVIGVWGNSLRRQGMQVHVMASRIVHRVVM